MSDDTAGHVGEERASSMRDEVFLERTEVTDFAFDSGIASVFDDMLERSIPFYREQQRMIVEVAAQFAQPGTQVYELGCSTGLTLQAVAERIDLTDVSLVGIDASPPMLDRARERLSQSRSGQRVSLTCADLNHLKLPLAQASVVVLSWTLQFVRPLNREELLRQVYDALVPGGAVVLCEKVVLASPLLNRLFIDLYHNYKRRQGYSDVEIRRKREALENVLVPYRVEENDALLRRCGFGTVETVFRWYNWAALVALKD